MFISSTNLEPSEWQSSYFLLPSCSAFWVHILLYSIPVSFSDIKLMQQMTSNSINLQSSKKPVISHLQQYFTQCWRQHVLSPWILFTVDTCAYANHHSNRELMNIWLYWRNTSIFIPLWGQRCLTGLVCVKSVFMPFPNDFTWNHLTLLKPELNSICYLLALLAHHFLHVSRIRVKSLTLRFLMSYIYIYIYGAPILDVSRSHTMTQHSR